MTRISLTTAKHLKEAGYPQNTKKWWAKRIIGQRISDPSVKSVGAINAVYVYPYILGDDFVLTESPNEPGSFGFREAIAAPSTDELLTACQDLSQRKDVHLESLDGEWHASICVRADGTAYEGWAELKDTPSEALAHLWITLKKQGLLEKGGERV